MARLNLDKVKTSDYPKKVAKPAEVEQLEKKLKTRFPAGYKEYVTTLGEGKLSDWVRVYLPKQINRELKEWRKRIKEYWFWDEPPVRLTKERAAECIVIADTLQGDEVVFHPADPKRLFVLPRQSERSFEAGKDLLEAIEWLFGDDLGNPVKKRVFETWEEVRGPVKKADKAAKPSKKPAPSAVPGRTLLMALGQGQPSGAYNCVAFYLTDKHRRDSWDGKGPVNFDFAKVIARAQKHWGKPDRVFNIRIQSTPLGKKPYYYVSLKFRSIEQKEIYLDLDGNVIEPELHKFHNWPKCSEFMGLLLSTPG